MKARVGERASSYEASVRSLLTKTSKVVVFFLRFGGPISPAAAACSEVAGLDALNSCQEAFDSFTRDGVSVARNADSTCAVTTASSLEVEELK